MKKLKSLIFILFLICNSILTSAQNKVVILDSVQAKKIINQLIQGDFAKAELKIFKQMDSVSQNRIETLKNANKYLLTAYDEKQLEVDNYKSAVEKQSSIIKKEKRKKNFYKYLSFLSIGVSGYFILTK